MILNCSLATEREELCNATAASANNWNRYGASNIAATGISKPQLSRPSASHPSGARACCDSYGSLSVGVP